MSKRTALHCTAAALTALAALSGTAQRASAVVGGTPVDPATVPWYGTVAGCGGSLVAPDRVVTAAHCVDRLSPRDLRGLVRIAGVTRDAARVALHPGYTTRNGEDLLDDLALVRLAAPVAGVDPVEVGGPDAAELTILGSGWTAGVGSSETDRYGGGLRQAVLRPLSDAACAAAWRGRRGNGGERFDARRMRCAVDVDGLPPLSSGCNGDSGGPLYAGSPARPLLLGVVSWGGLRCGADGLPSVFADVVHAGGFVTDRTPVWAPASTARRARITGVARVGRTLTCRVAGRRAPGTRVTVTWERQGGGPGRRVGRGTRYTVRAADRGHVLLCRVLVGNDGGQVSAPVSPRALRRVPR